MSKKKVDKMSKQKNSKQEEYLLQRIKENKRITNWVWNDDFLIFWDSFYKDIKSMALVKRRFTYYANNLVKRNIANEAIRIGLGRDGFYDFGVRTQTFWEINEKEKKG